MNLRSCLRRGQRTILMASLFLKLFDNRTSGPVALAICNAELKLVENIDALKFPEALKNMLWSDTVMNDVQYSLEQGDVETACEKIWKKTPKLIRYGEDTLRDLQLTLRHVLRVRYNQHA